MNNKPNVPEELITLNPKKYSFRTDMKVSSWLLMAALATAAGDAWFYHHKDCSFVLRIIIALVPLPPTLLWIRSMARWIRSMDELHRRITIDALVFATTGTLVVVLGWLRLNQTGILKAIFHPLGRIAFTFENGGALTGYYALILGLWFSFLLLGYFIFNRRYK
jgi:hypothetical protein